MHSFCKLQVAHLRVTKNLMMKTLPDMGSPSYLFSTARWAEDFFLYFILVFCDAYRWISVWRYFNTSSDASNAFCWFLFPGRILMVPCWKECGRSAYWSIEYIKETPISTQKKKKVFTHVASNNANLMEKKPFLHKKKVQLWHDWFGTADDMAAVLLFWNGCD